MRLIIILIPSVIFSVYFMLNRELVEAIGSLGIGIGILCMLKYMEKRTIKTRIDETLTTVIFHMYSLALGETSPSDLVNTIADNQEYGFYNKIFKKIRNLSKDFGYGITNATAQIAKTVKPPLKDILVRCTNTFSSAAPKGYLEMEDSMLIEEYSGYYTRMVKVLEALGGVFVAFQSVTIFLIMTLVFMTVFMTSSGMIPLGYIASILLIIMTYFLFRHSTSDERTVFIGKNPPKSYKCLKWSTLFCVPTSAVLSCFIYLKMGAPFAFITFGSGATIPGIFGYMIERRVAKIDMYYPTFLKALGENLASTSDLKTSLSFILHMELGALRNLVRSALARVNLGINHRQSLETLSEDAASYQVHISNKILFDSLGRGADPLVIGNALGNRVVKFLEFRKMRDVVANSFQMVVLVTQPLTVVLLTVMEVLAVFMSTYLAGVAYFGFNTMPIGIIEIGNIILIFVTAVVNSLAVKAVSGGYWGTFFLNLGILLIISGVTWIASYNLIQGILNSMPTFKMPV